MSQQRSYNIYKQYMYSVNKWFIAHNNIVNWYKRLMIHLTTNLSAFATASYKPLFGLETVNK